MFKMSLSLNWLSSSLICKTSADRTYWSMHGEEFSSMIIINANMQCDIKNNNTKKKKKKETI